MLGKVEKNYIRKLNIKKFNEGLRKNENIFQEEIDRYGKYERALKFYYSNIKVRKDNNIYKTDFTTDELLDMTIDFFKELSPELGARAEALRKGEAGNAYFHEPRDFHKPKVLTKTQKIKKVVYGIKKLIVEDIFHNPVQYPKDLLPSIENMPHRNSCGFRNGEKYIEIEPENHLTGYVRVAHEMMHGCTQFNFKKGEWFKDVVVDEIDSRLAERLMADYVFSKGIISQKEYHELLNCFNHEQRQKLGDALREFKMIKHFSKILKQRDITKQDLAEYCNDSKGPIVDYMKSISSPTAGRMAHELEYVLGSVVANNLYDEYKSNPRRFMLWYENNLLDNMKNLTLEEATILCGKKVMKIEDLKNLTVKDKRMLSNEALKDMSAKHLVYIEKNTQSLDRDNNRKTIENDTERTH